MMWEKKSLGVIADVYNGNSINADYKKKHFLGLAEGLPFIATKDVLSNGEIDYENGVKVPLDAGLKIAPADSVFVCAEGGSAGKKIAFVKEDVCFGNKLFCIHPKKKELYSAKYIYYFCRSELFREQFFGELTGLIGGVSAKKFRSIECPIPPLPEQERIVSLLDAEFAKIDAIKANAEKQLQDAKALFQSALKELSSPKEGWSKNSLGEIATEMYRGNGITRAQVTKEGISCVRYGEIYTAYNYHFSNCISCTEEKNIPSKKYFEYGDILFAITGESVEDIGKSIAYLGKDKCLAGGDIVVMKHALNPKFLGYVLSAPYVIKQKGFGKTKLKVVHTNIPSLKSIIIHYPPSLSEQHQIAEQLDKISAKIQSLQSNFDTTITLCNDLKQSILKDIFG